MRRLTLPELKALKPGEKVHVRYDEHGDDSPGRLNGKFVVIENNDEMLLLKDGYGVEEFPWKDWDDPTQQFDNGEGIATVSR